MRDRGQSEIVGFILVFGMIMLTLSIVAATGYAGLEGAREFERTNNAQRGMTLLAANIDDVTQGTPSRATELKLADATLTFASPVTIEITGEQVGNPTTNFTFSTTVQPIVYNPRTGAKVVYVNGAVIREESQGTVMIRNPNMVLANQTAVIPIVRTTSPQNRSIGGSTTTLVQTVHTDGKIIRSNTTHYELTVTIKTPRPDAWYRYLASQPATSCNQNETTVSCSLTTQRVSVTVDQVRVRFT